MDYNQVATTSHKCMRLMPSSNRELQKVVIGDSTGVVQLFSVKNREPAPVFKTAPSKRISRIELAGKFGTDYDRIFAASVSQITGYSKKGKQFYNFDTGMTEPIKSMAIQGDHLCVSGSYVYNLFKDSTELAYYLCSDKINDLIVLPQETETSKLVPVLACHDRALRVLDDSMMIYEAEVAGPPKTLSLYNRDGGFTGREVLYGTSDGKCGLIELSLDEPVPKWEMANEKRLNGISNIDSFDVTNDGIMDLIVSREDGIIEVYVYDSMDQPFLKYTHVS